MTVSLDKQSRFDKHNRSLVPLINHGQFQLLHDTQTHAIPTQELQTVFVSRFQQAWPQFSMHVDRRPDDLIRQFVQPVPWQQWYGTCRFS